MFLRLYHVSSVAFSFKKQSVKLIKMINPKNKRKWNYTCSDSLPTTKNLSNVTKGPTKRATRRVAVLNKLFMKYITDLMSTGTSSFEVIGRGIEISKVIVTPDFDWLKVYWVCKGTTSDIETEKILNDIAGPLRHELSSLRLMGEVPYIVFVKDTQEAIIYDIDQRLSKADYGVDYEPTQAGQLLKSDFTLSTKLSPEMKAKIKVLEGELALDEEPIPEMSHVVYGLDHAVIMKRLLGARKKSQDAWKGVDENNAVISYRSLTEEVQINKTKNDKQELADFLRKRQIMENKILKEIRRSRVERDMLLEEEAKKYATLEAGDDVFDDEDDDYYADEESLPAEEPISNRSDINKILS